MGSYSNSFELNIILTRRSFVMTKPVSYFSGYFSQVDYNYSEDKVKREDS